MKVSNKFYHDLFQDAFFSVFVEVAKFRKWIDDKIAANGGATYC